MPHRQLFPAVRSSGRTARILRFPTILQTNPWTLQKSTHGPTSSLRKFCKRTLNNFQNQPTVQPPLSVLFAKKPKLFRNTTRCPSLLGLACHSVRGPQWAKFSPMFVLSIILFLITNKFAQTLKLLSKSQKIVK